MGKQPILLYANSRSCAFATWDVTPPRPGSCLRLTDASASAWLRAGLAGVELSGACAEDEWVDVIVGIEFTVFGDICEGLDVDSIVYGSECDVGFM